MQKLTLFPGAAAREINIVLAQERAEPEELVGITLTHQHSLPQESKFVCCFLPLEELWGGRASLASRTCSSPSCCECPATRSTSKTGFLALKYGRTLKSYEVQPFSALRRLGHGSAGEAAVPRKG